MNLIIPLLLLGLSGCASQQLQEQPQAQSQSQDSESGPTIYGQVSGSVDHISTN